LFGLTEHRISAQQKALYVSGYIMRPQIIIVFVIFFGIVSCKSKQRTQIVDPTSKELYDSAMHLSTKGDNLSRTSALDLLNKTTAIDSNYYQAYFDKLPLLLGFKNYSKAIETIDNMIRLKPTNPDLNITRGILCEHIGDSITSKKYFQKGLKLYNAILDTIPKNTDSYSYTLLSKGVCLILLGEDNLGHKILNELYNSKIDNRLRTSIELVNNKSRKEILESSF
jgi:tetratricopeptide (TPR) repeat protein